MDWQKIFSKRWDVRLSVAFVIVSAIAMALLLRQPRHDGLRHAVAAIWVIWTVFPPLYFLMEWTAFSGDTESEEFKRMKYNHELSSKFWLGGIGVVSAVLVIAYKGIDEFCK